MNCIFGANDAISEQNTTTEVYSTIGLLPHLLTVLLLSRKSIKVF